MLLDRCLRSTAFSAGRTPSTQLPRAVIIDIGMELNRTLPPSGHVAPRRTRHDQLSTRSRACAGGHPRHLQRADRRRPVAERTCRRRQGLRASRRLAQRVEATDSRRHSGSTDVHRGAGSGISCRWRSQTTRRSRGRGRSARTSRWDLPLMDPLCGLAAVVAQCQIQGSPGLGQ